MDERAIRGVPWTFLSFGLTKVVTLVATVILGRLLDPEDFGLMALAVLAFGLIGVFRDLGLGATLVLRQDFDRRAQGTVFTLLLGTGVVVMLVVAALSPLAASLLDEPRLKSILPAFAITAVVGAVAWYYESLLQREFEFRRRFVGQMVQSLTFAVVAISLAAAGVGVWSLVIGQIASISAYAGTYLLIVPHRIRPRFDPRIARESFSTGIGFLAQGWLGWLNQNVDYIVISKAMGATQLGYYSMAYRLTELTEFGVAEPVAKVTFPAFARMRHLGESITAAYLSSLRSVGLVVALIGSLVSATADPFVITLFGDRWEAMVGPLAVLGIWAALKPVQSIMSWLLNSTGLASALAIATAVLLPLTVPALIVAASHDLTLVAWVAVAETTVSIAILLTIAQRKLEIRAAQQMLAIAPMAVAGGLTWVSARAVVGALDDAPALLCLLAGLAAGTAVYAVSLLAIDRDAVLTTVRQVLRALGRGGEQAAPAPLAAPGPDIGPDAGPGPDVRR